jgi:hypothetical protein
MILITTFVELRVVAGRSRTEAGGSLWIVDANSHMLCHAHAALCRGREKSLSERHGLGMARVRHRHGMASVYQRRPHCVNQTGKTQSIPLATRNGLRTAWYVWISLKRYLVSYRVKHRIFCNNTSSFCVKNRSKILIRILLQQIYIL